MSLDTACLRCLHDLLLQLLTRRTWLVSSPPPPDTGANQEGRQPRAGGQVVQSRPQDHRVSDSHRRHAGVPRGALHAAVRRIDVPGHGPRPSTGATQGPDLGVDIGFDFAPFLTAVCLGAL